MTGPPPPLQVLEDINVAERLAVTGAGVMREYTVRLTSFPDSKLPKDAQVSFAQVRRSASQCFLDRRN